MHQGILLFYILGTTIIGLLVPSNSSGLALNGGTAASSPFVIAIKRSGIKALPSVRKILSNSIPVTDPLTRSSMLVC